MRKLVVVGDKDSGKTSWARVFTSVIPQSKIAVLTKEEQFGASMIQDDTELLYLDEWTKKQMSDDLLKTVLQGGFFPQAVKHSAPKMQEMNAGVYITCNNLPDYQAEQENVDRQLYICPTIELTEKVTEAPEWISNNAMQCIVWMGMTITANVKLLERDERFYELPRNVKANALIKTSITVDELEAMTNSSIFSTEIRPHTPSVELHIHPCFSADRGTEVTNNIVEKGNSTIMLFL